MSLKNTVDLAIPVTFHYGSFCAGGNCLSFPCRPEPEFGNSGDPVFIHLTDYFILMERTMLLKTLHLSLIFLLQYLLFMHLFYLHKKALQLKRQSITFITNIKINYSLHHETH